jgi:predicted AlkP superfamily pyrophosphatase or phosphodiesterase
LPGCAGGQFAGSPRPRHVVLIVWDGMRPDFARPDTTPNLERLAQRGVTFTNHHSVYLTATEVNGAALATGAAPRVNGIMANREYRPGINPRQAIDLQDPAVIARGDELSGGKYLAVPTLPELARRDGLRTAVAGTKQVAYFFDRTLDESKRAGCLTLAEGATIPGTAIGTIGERFPAMGQGTRSRCAQDQWTTHALCDVLWRAEVPAVSVLWLAEPDNCQHTYGPGSPEALAAIRNADDCLGVVVGSLEKRGVLEQTDILIVSDHGFSTIEKNFGAAKELVEAGFDAAEVLPKGQELKTGQVMVSGNGGSVLYYVGGHDSATIERLVRHFKDSEYAGVILTREGAAGTFRLADAAIDTPDAPDVVVAMRWDSGPSGNGTPGHHLWSEGGRKKGQGTHVTLSPFDVHNTLIAAGPGFKRGIRSSLPSGNADVTPTLCALLDIKPDPRQTGRVLAEALEGREGPTGQPVTSILRSPRDGGEWRQYLKRTEFGGCVYVDEGGRGEGGGAGG